ncbi:MAG: hypothetical protein R3F35_06700 [Myxococcota bacterium]
MDSEGLAQASDAELLGSHRRSWHPSNASKPIQDWSLAELDAAAAFCERLVEELTRRGLLSTGTTGPTGEAAAPSAPAPRIPFNPFLRRRATDRPRTAEQAARAAPIPPPGSPAREP